ncbi:MAG: hypothetical protein QOG58_1841 [Caballeronia sp.]|nr:hypothetical protein [Caballeronia sp.]
MLLPRRVDSMPSIRAAALLPIAGERSKFVPNSVLYGASLAAPYKTQDNAAGSNESHTSL